VKYFTKGRPDDGVLRHPVVVEGADSSTDAVPGGAPPTPRMSLRGPDAADGPETEGSGTA
jgi:hypothetical protein